MRSVLTSWKEVAQYMGKGVRTVQRWERHFGLPIRRPQANSQRAVLAIPEEIDAWVCNRTHIRNGQSPASELEQLRSRIAQLENENQALRRRLAALGVPGDWNSADRAQAPPGMSLTGRAAS